MNTRAVVVGVVSVVLSSMCLRAGLWQFSRYQEKRVLARHYREALAAPPVALPADPAAWEAVSERRVLATGELDGRWQILLSDRWRGDSAGVEVLTPLRLDGGAIVLLDRGGLPSADGIHPSAVAWAEPGVREWLALLEPLPPHARTAAWERLRADSAGTLWSARSLGADSLAAHAPFATAAWVLRALPDPAAPALPARSLPEPPDAIMNLSYVVQWFLFALAFLAGGWFVLRRPGVAAGPRR
jgi:cytochrome oxidase assembly protein ShyY1